MKKLLAAFAMGLLLVGCAREYDDSELRNRVTTLETKVGNLEANMLAIQSATADGMFVQKVEELVEDGKVVGITVTYTTNKVVTFQISGAGAETNLSVVRNAAGVLCWALNGQIIQVDGQDLPVGQTPSFSVENGHLFVTVDGKKTDVGAMGGGLGDAIFKDIQVTDKAVVLTLDDNSTIEIPFAKAFKLVIAKTQYAVTTTDPIEIPYTVENKTANTVVDVFTDANFDATVDAEKITVTPLAVTKGSALAYADSQVGLTSIVKLTFGGEAEPDTFEITDESIEYIAEAKDAVVEAHAVSNLAFEVKPQVDWIHFVETRAQNYTIVLKVDDNPTEEIRTGEVKIVRAGTEEVLQTITIAQKAGEGEPAPELEPYTPAGWDKVFDMSNYQVNSTFRWQDGPELNPSAITFQWKFWSNKWNNHKFEDKGEGGYTLYCNRLSEIAQYDESNALLLRFSNDGDADGQLCLNADFLGVGQKQVGKDGQPYVWPTGEWVVLTIVSDGTTVSIYDDEELVTSYTATPRVNAWKLGRFDLSMTWDDGSSWPRSQAFNGYIAYARVWSRALGVEDIAATLCEVPADKAEGLEANWVFDGKEDKYIANTVAKNEGLGLDFTDCWDGNDNRKDNGDAAAAAWKTLADAGMEGICYREKGSGDQPGPGPQPGGETLTGKVFKITPELSENWLLENPTELTNATIEWHFYANSWHEPGMPNRLGAVEDRSEHGVMLRFSNGSNAGKGQLHLSASYLIGSEPQVTKQGESTPYIFEAGMWHTLSAVMDGTNISIYDNGEFINSYAMNSHQSFNFERLEWGMSWDERWDDTGYCTSQLFDGFIDYVRVWTVARSQSEIVAGLCDVPSDSEGLFSYWRFTDEPDNSYMIDRAGNNDIDWDSMSQMDGSSVRQVRALGDAFKAARVDFDGNICALPAAE
ncbi:MAG: hypothetical protein IJP73_03560 [Bacteroidales bacterium]|nr:hypothetical protein [Bacteroidales bacterium]